MLKSRFKLVPLTFLLIFICSCASVQLGEDPQLKAFAVAQKEVKHSLLAYKQALLSQPPEVQKEWHEKYDEPIKAMVGALEGWRLVATGVTSDTGQMAKFMALKNQLIILGWNYFKGGD